MRRPGPTALTPAMLRTRYHERRGEPLRKPDAASLPPLGADDERDATAEWLAHIAAGRIEVR